MSQQAFEEKLYANLEAVIDPELGVDIINLGLFMTLQQMKIIMLSLR